jgi:hypothetical protein
MAGSWEISAHLGVSLASFGSVEGAGRERYFSPPKARWLQVKSRFSLLFAHDLSENRCTLLRIMRRGWICGRRLG